MIELTHSEANTAIAEKVMGKCIHDYEVTWSTALGVKSPSGALCGKCKERLPLPTGSINEWVYDYTPTSNIAQAFEALEKWSAKEESISWMVGDGLDGVYVRLYVDYPHYSNGDVDSENESIPLAICEALLSAVMGEQVTIKEVE